MTFIVGIGHVSRTGKDTAAEALCRDLGFVRRGFADQLKELAFVADPLVTSATRTVNTNIGHGRLAWVVKSMGGWEAAKDTYPEVRVFLQNLGDGGRRVFGNDFWVDRLLESLGDEPKVVIPDVRYRSEADKIQALGGVVVRINRPGRDAKGHISETELTNWTGWDEEFENRRGIAELQADVVGWVKNQLQLRQTPVKGMSELIEPGPLDLDVLLHQSAGLTARRELMEDDPE